MNNYPNVTEQNLINFVKLAEQQKNQTAPKFKKKKGYTHDEKLAKSCGMV